MTQSVVLLDETADIGGAEINLLMVAPRLAQSSWQPRVVVPADGRLAERLRELNVTVDYVARPALLSSSFYVGHRYKLPNPLALIINTFLGLIWVLRLYRFLRRANPTVVQTVSMWSHAFGGMAARLSGYPVVWHFQSVVSDRAGLGLYRKLVLLWARLIPDRIICISDLVAAQFQDDPRLSGKLDILWNTIDLEQYGTASLVTPPHPPAPSPTRGEGENVIPLPPIVGEGGGGWGAEVGNRAARGRESAALIIGTVARLTPWKGQEVALAAARELKRQRVPFRWLFAGEEALGAAGYRARLVELIQRWGLEAEVELVGWVADMPAFYRTVDALVHLPIEPEPFGLVLAEAIAAGLPVISTAGGGADQIVAAAGGALVPPGESNAVAEILARLAKDPAERARLGAQARRLAEQRFGAQAYAEHLIQIYQLVVDKLRSYLAGTA